MVGRGHHRYTSDRHVGQVRPVGVVVIVLVREGEVELTKIDYCRMEWGVFIVMKSRIIVFRAASALDKIHNWFLPCVC